MASTIHILTMVGTSLSTSLFTAVKAVFDKRDFVYILVMGRTGTGKTSFINTATESHLAVGSALSSRTHNIQLSRSVRCDSRRVVLIDTPGLDDTSRSTEDAIRMVSAYLAKMRKKGRVVQGAIYLHRISDNRMGQVALQSLHAFQNLCAQEALHHIAIVLSMWEDVAPDVRDGRRKALCERELYFKPLIEAGAVALAYDRTADSAHEVMQHLVKRTPQTAAVCADASDPCPVPVRLPVSRIPRRLKWEVHSREAPLIVVRLDNAASDVDMYGEKPIEVPMGHWNLKDEFHKASMGVENGSRSPGSGRVVRIVRGIRKFLCKSFRKQRMTT